MEKFINWIVFSSENPKQVAMTIRGLLVAQVPLVLSFLHEMNIVSYDSIITKAIITGTASLGILLVVVGMVRKLLNLIKEPKKSKKK